MDTQTLSALLHDLESDRVERKAAFTDRDRIYQAVCAYANDLSNHREPGVLFLGANDDGSPSGLRITDELLLSLSDLRGTGKILPFPVLTVEKRVIDGSDFAVIIVEPSDSPPVRFDGRVWIRVGPRRAIATAEEERRLTEKRRCRDVPFDLRPLGSASLDDLDLLRFREEYLPSAVAPDILQENNRDVTYQLASLRFAALDESMCPTVLGILVIGKEPLDYVPGAYVQFLRIDGLELTDPIRDQKQIGGAVSDQLRILDEVLVANISVATDLTSQSREVRSPDYPLVALQQLARNAVIHRDYETSNSPVRVTWYNDRIEIQNPGGLYGTVRADNFGNPGVTDYRNPHLAAAMFNLGYVQRFGMGIAMARNALAGNGCPPPEFVIEPSHVLAIVRKRQ